MPTPVIITPTLSSDEIRRCMRALNETQRATAANIAVELWESHLAGENLGTAVETVAHTMATIVRSICNRHGDGDDAKRLTIGLFEFLGIRVASIFVHSVAQREGTGQAVGAREQ